MIRFEQGNLLESDAEALVNTVNTVGVMGKGIALMFKERFKDNFKLYQDACKDDRVNVGELFVTQPNALIGPKWIVNFPTKKHWRQDSQIEWIQSGLGKLREFIVENNVHSIAIPPLGAGNGGLHWPEVKGLVIEALDDLEDVEIVVFEPTSKYQNVQKRKGVQKLTPARALIAELVRRYWIIGLDCSLLEVQKLAWFAERFLESSNAPNELNLQFQADKFGPYATRLNHLMDALDGSYLHCEKRIADAGPRDSIWFEESRKDLLITYIRSSEFDPYNFVLEKTTEVIDGFESPYGMELLATVDWIRSRESRDSNVSDIRDGLKKWGKGSKRKLELFNERAIAIALDRLEGLGV